MCATGVRARGGVRALLADPRTDVNRTWMFSDFTALHFAVWTGYDDIVRLFLKCPRVDVNRVDNIQGTILGTITLLGDKRIDVNVLTLGGETALCKSARSNNTFGVRLLLAHPRIQIHLGTQSILHFALPWATKAVMETLLEDKRIDVNLVDKEQRTALHLAAYLGRIDVIQLLLDRDDTDVEKLDGDGLSARGLALSNYPEFARCFTIKKIVENKG
ncbi:ankyrin, partial [Tuber magnatum]